MCKVDTLRPPRVWANVRKSSIIRLSAYIRNVCWRADPVPPGECNLFYEYAPTANFSFRRLRMLFLLCAVFFLVSVQAASSPLPPPHYTHKPRGSRCDSNAVSQQPTLLRSAAKKKIKKSSCARPNWKRVSQQPVNTKRSRVNFVPKYILYTSNIYTYEQYTCTCRLRI